MAAISVWTEPVNILFVGINLFFFSFSILSYIVHGLLQDTNNQFRSPHVLGKWTLPKSIMLMAMMALVVGEIVATLGLLFIIGGNNIPRRIAGVGMRKHIRDCL